MQGQCQLAAAPASCLVDGQDANPSTTKQPEPQTPVNYMTDSPQATKDIDHFRDTCLRSGHVRGAADGTAGLRSWLVRWVRHLLHEVEKLLCAALP
jgi:hypothetical protein